jgi:hypothetical protein
VPNPVYRTLAADQDTTVTLDANYGNVEVAIVANAAVVQFNTTGTVISSSTLTDGNHAVSATLPAKIVRDETSGGVTVVHLRSSGTPTVSVCGL